MIGITLQFVAMLYMAGFLLADTNVDDLDTQTSSEKRAATGAIVMIYLSGFGWAMVSFLRDEEGTTSNEVAGLELNPIFDQLRDLPSPVARHRRFICYDVPLCEPIWQFQGSSRDVQ